MADELIRIPNLVPVSSANGNEIIPVSQDGNPRKMTTDNVEAYVENKILPVNTNGISDKAVTLDKFSDAAKEYIGSAGNITNYPDDVTLELSGGVIKLKDVLLHSIFDNIFIMYHRASDNFPIMVKPHKWPSLQTSGEIADGVVIAEGGHVVVVAPTGAVLQWSSAPITGGGTSTGDRATAIADWNGEANTAAQVTHAECSGVNYAPGYCNLYSRTNKNGQGLTAGKWWLPSVGEMMMIYANMQKVNYALGLITNATQLVDNWHWTSTENDSSTAWILYLNDGGLLWDNRTSHIGFVRAVSAFIL